MPISKSQIKLISSLSIKKFRDETGFFIAEGTKLVGDLASVFDCEMAFATQSWLSQHGNSFNLPLQEVSDDEMNKISQQKTPQGILAVFHKQVYPLDINNAKNNLLLALDNVQDPGNLGTIIRIADWFGIKDILCSPNTADVFAPKVVQATMGALARVKVHYLSLPDLLKKLPHDTPIFGTFMEGNNIYAEQLSTNGIIVLGNEGNGISPEVEKLVTRKLMIPEFSGGEKISESLNVAIAGAIVCSEFKRRQLQL